MIYPCRPASRFEQLALIGAGLLMAFAPAAYGVILHNYGYTHYGPVAADAWSQPWSTAGLVGFAGWLVLLAWRWLHFRYRVALLSEGVQIRNGLGNGKLWRWADIHGISTETVETHWLGRRWATRQSARLFLANGRQSALTDRLENLPELITRLKANLYPRRLPEYRATLRDGQWLTFGPLNLHRSAGIHQSGGLRAGTPIPWGAIKQITVRDGLLVLESSSGSLIRRPVGEIPNLELFLQLIREEV